MPLRDHFHPPLTPRRRWNSFHAGWATYLCSSINKLLPPGYWAEPLCTFVVEVDVATFEESEETTAEAASWTPPEPALTIVAAPPTDTVEVQIKHQEYGDLVLAGCIELVSPSNKDRPSEREAFVAKCATYLHQGAGLLLVDVVTERRANLHQALLAQLGSVSEGVVESYLYVAAYRPVARNAETRVSVWQEKLTLGEPLPAMPLWLKDGPCLRIDLEGTYEQTCQELRLIVNGTAEAG